MPEILPLSASPPTMVLVELDVARAGHIEHHSVAVPHGSPLRAALRLIGQAGEGCAVLEGERSVPLDLPIVSPSHFTVVPTFSGG